jgi:hypothetical protein
LSSYDQLADRVRSFSEEVDFLSFDAKRLLESRGGLRQYFIGKLFQEVVVEIPEIKDRLRLAAALGIVAINLDLEGSTVSLKNGKGDTVSLRGQFGVPRRALKVYTNAGKEFRDVIEVSEFIPDRGQPAAETKRYTWPGQTEIKKARGDAYPQMDRGPSRIENAPSIKWIYEDTGESVVITPEQLIIHPSKYSSQLVIASKDEDVVKLVPARTRPGSQEFIRYDAFVDVTLLAAIVAALMRAR